MSFVYRIRNKKTGAIYIGKARDLVRRWKEHVTIVRYFDHPLYKALREDGIENFVMETIDELPSDQAALERETSLIREAADSGIEVYNKTIEGKLNYVMTPEIREKLRSSGKKGSLANSKRKGISLSEEHRAKLREASKRYWQRKRESEK